MGVSFSNVASAKITFLWENKDSNRSFDKERVASDPIVRFTIQRHLEEILKDQNILREILSDDTPKSMDLEDAELKYIARGRDSYVFKLSLFMKNAVTGQTAKIERALKWSRLTDENEWKRLEESFRLADEATGHAARIYKRIGPVFYQEWVKGLTVWHLQLKRSKDGLRKDELEQIARIWLSIWRAASPGLAYEDFPADPNAANIMSRHEDDAADPDFAVIDLDLNKAPRTATFVVERLSYYAQPATLMPRNYSSADQLTYERNLEIVFDEILHTLGTEKGKQLLTDALHDYTVSVPQYLGAAATVPVFLERYVLTHFPS